LDYRTTAVCSWWPSDGFGAIAAFDMKEILTLGWTQTRKDWRLFKPVIPIVGPSEGNYGE